ncbi:hypothetical protein C2W64_00489 [Brevibacillus laterosporus]|nr:hypothetical protein C2W64_00489 [Brevibacillus laterosporus]
MKEKVTFSAEITTKNGRHVKDVTSRKVTSFFVSYLAM